MPLFREWTSDAFSLAAIWKIEEPEDFFIQKTKLQPAIKNEKRRMEHLAGRFLLQYLKVDFPLLHIAPDAHDKPRLPNNDFYFSISHSYPYVAAVVSPHVECGIDIQTWHPRMETLQHKFLNDAEQKIIVNDSKKITEAWSVKEAAYKWQGRRGVEFREHLIIEKKAENEHDTLFDVRMILTALKNPISIKAFTATDFSLAIVIHNHIFHPH